MPRSARVAALIAWRASWSSLAGNVISLSHRTSGGEMGRERRSRAWSRTRRSKVVNNFERISHSGRSVTNTSTGWPLMCSPSIASSRLRSQRWA